MSHHRWWAHWCKILLLHLLRLLLSIRHEIILVWLLKLVLWCLVKHWWRIEPLVLLEGRCLAKVIIIRHKVIASSPSKLIIIVVVKPLWFFVETHSLHVLLLRCSSHSLHLLWFLRRWCLFKLWFGLLISLTKGMIIFLIDIQFLSFFSMAFFFIAFLIFFLLLDLLLPQIQVITLTLF